MGKPFKTTEEYLNRIRDFYRKYGRTPRTRECGEYTNIVLTKRLGSWRTAIRAALGEHIVHIAPTKEQLLHQLRTFFETKGRLPTPREIRYSGIAQKNGGVNALLLEATGKNYCTYIGDALRLLTPPGCDTATTREIHREVAKKIPLNIHEVRMYLMEMKRAGMIDMVRLNRCVAWRRQCYPQN